MGRRYQRFLAPGKEELPLPIPESPWHLERRVRIPAEHWELLIEFAQEKIPEYGDLIEKASCLDGDFSKWSMKKTADLHTALENLCLTLSQSENFTYKGIDEIYEDYPNDVYISMIQAIIAVVDESLKTSKFFDSYVD
jgi:hypothetical protein